MSKFTTWLVSWTGGRMDGSDRRQGERPPIITAQASDFDPVTGALLSDRFMSMVAVEQALRPGALLLIDMVSRANYVAPRDPNASREALILMALAIRQAVRFDDLVGHVEGFRFAVLLRGAPQELAETVAQRICDSVNDTVFLTQEGIAQVDVAVGGAVFELGRGQDVYVSAQAALNAARDSGMATAFR